MAEYSAPQIVHRILGSPPVDGHSVLSGSCYVCGGTISRGTPVVDWMSSSYTDQNRVARPASTHVCESCGFITSRLSPVPGRPAKEGKSFGGNYRNYSHLWESGWCAPPCGEDTESLGEYVNASKGQKPLIRSFLERKHTGDWFAAIADSGQKHVLPYTTINAPGRGGVIMFDDAIVNVPVDTSLIGVMVQLLTDGATKEEIERGDYRPVTWQRIGKDRLREFERSHGKNRGHWFALSIWLAQRDEESVAERMAHEKIDTDARKESEKNATRKPREPKSTKPKATTRGRTHRVDCDVPRPDAASVQRSTTDELLGADIEPPKVIVAPVSDSGGVDNVSPARAKNPVPVQFGLFGNLEPSKPVRRKRV